jgi:hypothetical protein
MSISIHICIYTYSYIYIHINIYIGKNMSNQNGHYDRASPLAPDATPSPSTLSSLYELLVFFFKYYTRDQGYYYLRIMVLTGIAFFLGTLYVMMERKTDIYIYTYIYIYIFIYIYFSICLYVCVYVHMYIYIYIYKYVQIYVYMHICI